MATTDATPIPVKNQAYRVTFPILDADGDLVISATGLDSEVSKDGGTFTDCTNEATQIATSSGMYYLDLTATEMNADTVAVVVKNVEGKTTPMIMYPNKSGGLAVNVTAWAGTATATGNIAIKNTLAKGTELTGFNDISAANVQTELGAYGAVKPTTAGRTLDIATTGEAGLDFNNVAGTPPNSAGVTTLLTRIPSNLNITSGAIDISPAGVDAVWAKAMTELSAVPGVSGNVLQALEWIFLLARNKITQTSTTQVLRNDADSANIATSTVSDNGTTFTRGEFG